MSKYGYGPNKRKPFAILLIKFKLLLCRLGFTVTEICEVCGSQVGLVWWADNELYIKITNEEPVAGDNIAGIYCIKCFDELAMKQNIILQWVPKILA